MGKYTLYLDESETHTGSGDYFFAVGGVIIEDSQNAALEKELDLLRCKFVRLYPA